MMHHILHAMAMIYILLECSIHMYSGQTITPLPIKSNTKWKPHTATHSHKNTHTHTRNKETLLVMLL